MSSHRLRRIAVTVAALSAVAGGVVAAAPSAFAIEPGCGGTTFVHSYGVQGSSPQQVWVYAVAQYNTCPGGIPLIVSISKYVTGVGWEQVAYSTQGYTTYNCTGGEFLYTTSQTPANDDFYCG
jgi:hypothetical protein